MFKLDHPLKLGRFESLLAAAVYQRLPGDHFVDLDGRGTGRGDGLDVGSRLTNSHPALQNSKHAHNDGAGLKPVKVKIIPLMSDWPTDL